MPVPKRKHSRKRRDQKLANKGIKPKAFTLCKNCEKPVNPHVVCSGCGTYKGRKIMATKLERTLKRSEVRQAQATKMQAKQAKLESNQEPQE